MSFDGSDSEKVLSYGDVVLRKADVNLLSGEFWLNDVGRQGCKRRSFLSRNVLSLLTAFST